MISDCSSVSFLSTPSARRATLNRYHVLLWRTISIHALREEGDVQLDFLMLQALISIHALREEGDLERANHIRRINLFLSTPSARRATFPHTGVRRRFLISIHALREEGDRMTSGWQHTAANFYPRPPRGGRRAGAAIFFSGLQFLSTPSARRATGASLLGEDRGQISIHALREEGDLTMPFDLRMVMISIHALREEGDDAVV